MTSAASAPLAPTVASTLPGVTTLAIVVTAGTTPYLEQTLHAVARQTVLPQAVLIIDCASRTNGLGDGTPIETVVDESGLDAAVRTRIVRTPEAGTFLAALHAGISRYDELTTQAAQRLRGRASSQTAQHTGWESAPTAGLTPGGEGAAPARTRATGVTTPTTTQGIWAQARGGAEDPRRSTRETGQFRALRAEGVRGPRTGSLPVTAPLSTPLTTQAFDWLWLLHDDSAPEPECLEHLQAAVANTRSVAMAGPKQVTWEHADQLLEVGLRTTASARRANDIIDGEIDQGQYDARSDVLAVGTAGALLDRQAWEALATLPTDIGPFGDGLAMSHALRRTGQRIIVVPKAVLRHRRARFEGLREAPTAAKKRAQERALNGGEAAAAAHPLPPAEPNPDRSFRERRIAQLRSWATFSGRPLGFLLLWMLILGFGRAAWRLLTKEPALARDEIAAAFRTFASGHRLRRDRRRLASRGPVSRGVVAELYLPASQIRAARRDRVRQARERAARAAAPSELEVRELAALASRRRKVLGITALAALTMGLVGMGHVVVTKSVTGGALAVLGSSPRALWEAAWSSWAASGDGYFAALNPSLALLSGLTALGAMLGIGGDGVVHLILILALPLAALGAWAAAGCVTRRTTVRGWAALMWATAPALLLGAGQGRLMAVLVHLLLPWGLVAFARAIGADRRDVVLSGLVGAHRLSEEERAELQPLGVEGKAALARLDEEAELERQAAEAAQESDSAEAAAGTVLMPPAERESQAQREEEQRRSRKASEASAERSGNPASPVDDDPATPVTDDTSGIVIAAATHHGAAVRGAALEHYGPGSPTAAAVAGLIFGLITAASPASALITLPALLLAFLVARGKRLRLILTVLPVAATAAPAFWHAGRMAMAAGGPAAWREALRYLATDAGVPVGAPQPGGLEILLGLPVHLGALTQTAPWHVILGIVLVASCALLPACAVLGLLTGGRQAGRVRYGLLAAIAGWALASLMVRFVVAVGTGVDGSGSQLVSGWAGVGLSFAQAGLLLAAVAGADAARASLLHHHFGWRHMSLGIVGIAAVIVPCLLGSMWALAAYTSTGTGTSALAMALTPASQQIPVIAAEMEKAPTAGRVLVLTSTPEGMSVRLWRGEGTTAQDVTADVLAAQLHDRVGGPDAAPLDLALTSHLTFDSVSLIPGDAADASLASAVARALTGQDEGVADALAAHGIAVVLLTDQAGDAATADARAGLDSTPGLESLALTSVGASWRVTPSAGEASRVSLVAGNATTPVDDPSTGEAVSIAAADSERTLVLAERANSGWQASINGVALAPTNAGTDPWRQAFTVPAGLAGQLTIEHRSPQAQIAAQVIWAAWGVAILASLPLRRRRTIA